jgi:hypothetical protein
MELMPVYGPQFKEQIVKKMMPPHNQSVAQISRDTSVAVPTLYSWEKLFRNRWPYCSYSGAGSPCSGHIKRRVDDGTGATS